MQLLLGTRWWLRNPTKNHLSDTNPFRNLDILHIIWRRPDFSSSGGQFFFEKKWNHYLGFMVVLITVSKNLLLSLAWPMFHSCHRFGSSSPGSWFRAFEAMWNMCISGFSKIGISLSNTGKETIKNIAIFEEKRCEALSQAMDYFSCFCLFQSELYNG